MQVLQIILIGYWALCLLLGALVVIYQILLNIQATTSTRKIFHLLAVLVYIPGLIYEHVLLYLASGITMGLFIFLEVCQV